MAKKKNRNKQGQDQRLPDGVVSFGGVVQQPRKQKNQGRGGGQSSHGSAQRQTTGRKGRQKKGVVINALAEVVDQAREDGLVRHHEIEKAHDNAVMSIVITPDSVYTGSRDKTLKRWKVGMSPTGRFQLTPDLEVQLGDQCLCMCFVGEWIFCGLNNGSIRGFSKSGQESTLEGHKKRCQAILVHEAVLLSAGADATVKCWQMDPATQKFAKTHEITEGISGSAICMAILNGFLWVGGTSGVAIVEMASLKVVHQLEPKRSVANFLVFQDHVIVAYGDGSTIIFDGGGTKKMEQPVLPPGAITCIAGLPTANPRLLVGHAKGQISVLELPMFRPNTYFQALERCKVQCMACSPDAGIFIIGAENGALQLWQRDEALIVPRI